MKKELLVIPLFSVLLLAGCIGGGGQPQTNQTPAGGGGQTTGPTGPGPAAGTILSPFGPLSLSEAAGQDLPCIGRPSGMTRGMYTTTTDEYGTDTSIVYYKQGNDYENVKNFFVTKAEQCGYKKTGETTGSLSTPGFQIISGTNIDYEKGDETLSLGIGVFKLADGKEYTLVDISDSVYSEESGAGTNEETGGGTEESTGGTGFDSITEPAVTDADAQNYNNILKPVFVKVFGNTKLSDQAVVEQPGSKMISLTYVLENGAQNSKLADLKNELSQALGPEGFSNTLSTVSSDSFMYTYTDKHGSAISVSGEPDGEQVEVTIMLKQ